MKYIYDRPEQSSIMILFTVIHSSQTQTSNKRQQTPNTMSQPTPPTAVSSTAHSRSSSAASGTSLNRVPKPTIDEPPPPHPNRLVPQSTSTATIGAPQSRDSSSMAPPRSSPNNHSNTTTDVESLTSPSLSRTSSFIIDNSVHLTRISSPSHLKSLPSEFLSEDYLRSSAPSKLSRPLLHIDEYGNEYKYFLMPMSMAVVYILLVEMLERFSFYGINYTTTAYLTGE